MVKDPLKAGSVLVLGGGIAGIQASLDLAEMGYFVHLVEKNPAIGGRMAQLDKVFPTNDCAMCIISPKLNDCGSHINISTMTCSELIELSGEPGHFTAKIKKKSRFIDNEKCTACGDCAAACPVEIPSEFNMNLNKRKVTFKSYAQAFPNSFSVTKEGISPCVITCPAHVNAHGYVSLAAQGRFQEALEVIMDVLPLPGTLGRICAHPCEIECRRNQMEESLAIKDIKRLVSDNADLDKAGETFKKAEAKAEKVAIIGSGPAGLTAAWHLARAGIKSTIFEKESVAGGALKTGIPDYRLPPSVLQEEIDFILKFSETELKLNQCLGKDFTIEDLFKQGFGAIFLALGAGEDFKLNIPGEDAKQVISCTEFLRDANIGQKPDLSNKKVLVIGGGNVAMDVSRTAIRLGASEVICSCREGRDIMPAWKWEIEEAEEEGVQIKPLRTPKAFEETANGQITAKMALMVDNHDPRNFIEDPSGDLWTENFDLIILSVGQWPSTGLIKNGEKKEANLEFGRANSIVADPITLETSIKKVFAGGDVKTGASLAITAVAAGKEAAISIARLFNGEDLAAGRKKMEFTGTEVYRDVPLHEHKQYRKKMPVRDPNIRKKDFEEFELGFSIEEGMKESSRCISCGACCQCYRCVKACLPGALTMESHQEKEEIVELQVGSVVVATGFEPFDPSNSETYSYTKSPNIITSMEFERILSASGPYKGHMVRPSDHKEPQKIAWLQCVGSRDINRCDNEHCSAVCCMYAIKEAVIAKEHAGGDLDTSIFYMDIRTYGKDFEKYYNRAKDAGVRFVRSRIHTLTPQLNGDVALEYIDEDGQRKTEYFDMVVLSIGLNPGSNLDKLATNLLLETSNGGFLKTNFFDPLSTSRPGVYTCGAVVEPKDIPTTVMEASAAAEGAASEITESRFSETKVYQYPEERDIAGEIPRIGVFVCHCGINIGSVVDVPSVVQYAKTLPFVELAEHNLFTCSQDTQGKIKEAIIDNKLNRVVVASCSPRTHEAMFRETLAQAGLNKYLFEMANIRDHNSWVHQQIPGKATTKAKDLLRAAVAKAALLEPMHQTQMGLTREALIVGAGAAGLNCALSLAKQGFPVHLLEKTDKLGGQALKIFPRGTNVKDYMEKLIKEVEEHPLITVYKNTVPKLSNGFLGNFETVVQNSEEEKSIQHGVTILCAGGHEHQPQSYLYGESDQVILSLDMDALLASKDSKLRKGKNFVFIQCVESREEARPYCSKICCAHTIDNALSIKDMNPDANIYVLYRDIRTYGFKESLYHEARSKGIKFIRYDLDSKPQAFKGSDGRLQIQLKDHVLKRDLLIEPDLLTLASGIDPNPMKDLVEIFKGQLTADNFLLEAHMKLRPVDLATDGQYLAGLAHYPKPLNESITQAKAATARAITILAKPNIMVGGIVATVDPEKCAVCCTCVRACPVNVPKIVRNEQDEALRGHAFIEPAICQGCGICVAECPGKAIKLQFYTDEQLVAKVEALANTSTIN